MTILFLEDWYDTNAIVDTKTTNKTFIRLSGLLKEMGIKNYFFPLQLLNKDLQGIDPYDPDLDIETKIKIAIECKENYFYFIREIIRDPNSSVSNPLRYRANRANIAISWLYLNHITAILIQQRQSGKSFSIDCIATWLLNFAYTNSNIGLLTKDDTLRSANLARLKNLFEELPQYLCQLSKKDIANTEEIQIKSLNNKFIAQLPSKSPKQALNCFRGNFLGTLLIDETAFIYNIGISLPAMLAAGTAARDLAKQKNEPYGTILYTTAGKKDDRDGAYAYNLLTNSAIWSEKYYDAKNLEELEYLIRKNSPRGELRVNCSFNHRQLGYTDQQLKEAIERSESKGEDADRDFRNIWTSGSQSSPLSIELSNKIRESQIEVVHTEISYPHGYATRWYIPENLIVSKLTTDNTIMSLDSSEAVGNDDIGMVFRCVKSGEVLGVGNYNETNLISFCEWICDLLIKFDKITMIIERRSTGAMIIDYLLLMLPAKGIDPFRRIYNKVVDEALENKDRFKEIDKPMYVRDQSVYVKYKKLFGFSTSGTGTTSRTELYSTTLLSTAKLSGDKIRDVILINQILSLVVRNGRVDHPEGEHDDLVIALLLSTFLMLNARNLNYYGINSRDILLENRVHKEENNPVKQYNNYEQMKLRSEIEDLVEKIKNERDNYIVLRHEARLKHLSSMLNNEDRQSLAVDDLILSLREYRQSTTRNMFSYRR